MDKGGSERRRRGILIVITAINRELRLPIVVCRALKRIGKELGHEVEEGVNPRCLEDVGSTFITRRLAFSHEKVKHFLRRVAPMFRLFVHEEDVKEEVWKAEQRVPDLFWIDVNQSS